MSYAKMQITTDEENQEELAINNEDENMSLVMHHKRLSSEQTRRHSRTLFIFLTVLLLAASVTLVMSFDILSSLRQEHDKALIIATSMQRSISWNSQRDVHGDRDTTKVIQHEEEDKDAGAGDSSSSQISFHSRFEFAKFVGQGKAVEIARLMGSLPNIIFDSLTESTTWSISPCGLNWKLCLINGSQIQMSNFSKGRQQKQPLPLKTKA